MKKQKKVEKTDLGKRLEEIEARLGGIESEVFPGDKITNIPNTIRSFTRLNSRSITNLDDVVESIYIDKKSHALLFLYTNSKGERLLWNVISRNVDPAQLFEV